MNWRRLIRSRDFHALWIGGLLLTLALWFDVVWIAGLVVLLLAGLLLCGEWLVSLWNPGSRRRRGFD